MLMLEEDLWKITTFFESNYSFAVIFLNKFSLKYSHVESSLICNQLLKMNSKFFEGDGDSCFYGKGEKAPVASLGKIMM